MTVLIYVDTSKQVGFNRSPADHLQVFANADAAGGLVAFAENDPEGVAFDSTR